MHCMHSICVVCVDQFVLFSTISLSISVISLAACSHLMIKMFVIRVVGSYFLSARSLSLVHSANEKIVKAWKTMSHKQMRTTEQIIPIRSGLDTHEFMFQFYIVSHFDLPTPLSLFTRTRARTYKYSYEINIQELKYYEYE